MHAEAVLASWLVGCGGYIGPVSVESRNGLRGLFVTRGVSAGEPLVAVPRECTLRSSAQLDLSPAESLVRSLVREREGGRDSPYAAFIATLPASVPLLRDWRPAQLARLQAPRLAAAALAQKEWLGRLTSKLQDDDPQSLAWGESLVRSRGIACTEAGRQGLQLVPMLELANHRALGPADEPPVVETADGMTVLCAPTALERGDEATLEYTREGNARLLLDYGFAEVHGEGGEGGAGTGVGLDELEAMLRADPAAVSRLQLCDWDGEVE